MEVCLWNYKAFLIFSIWYTDLSFMIMKYLMRFLNCVLNRRPFWWLQNSLACICTPTKAEDTYVSRKLFEIRKKIFFHFLHLHFLFSSNGDLNGLPHSVHHFILTTVQLDKLSWECIRSCSSSRRIQILSKK